MTRKKRIVAATGAVVLALSLTACTVPAEPTPAAPAAPAPAEPAPYVPPVNTSDTAYLSVVREQIPDFGSVPDQTLVDAAESACDALEGGVPALTLIDMAMDSLDLDAYDAGFFIGAGVSVYCPRFSGDLL